MKVFFKQISAFLFLLTLIFFTQSSFAAEEYRLVLFYAPWNVYSNQAIETFAEVAKISDNIDFEQINIDDKKAFFRMKQLGITPTNTLPYYYLIDRDKKIYYKATYKQESVSMLLSILNKSIKK